MPGTDIPIGVSPLPRTTTIDGIPARSDLLFTNSKGEETKRIQKRSTKTVQKLRPALEKVLLPGETVLGAMFARSPSSGLEKLMASALVTYLKFCVVVATNERILFFPVKRNRTWRESVRAVKWGDVQDVRKTGFLVYSVVFKFKNGIEATYTGFRRADAARLAEIASVLIPAAHGEVTDAQGLIQLCPDCRGVLTAGRYLCPSCGLTFKNEKKMIWYSILLPAGGYFYTGHPLIAILPAIAEGLLLIDIGTLILAGIRSHHMEAALPGSLLLLLLVWAFETGITILHCRPRVRDFIPEKRDPARTPQALAAGLNRDPYR